MAKLNIAACMHGQTPGYYYVYSHTCRNASSYGKGRVFQSSVSVPAQVANDGTVP
jgi:hypothetical protein